MNPPTPFTEPSERHRASNEFVETLWRIARGLSQRHGLGLEEAYEILERVDPKVKVNEGKVVRVSFDKQKINELVLAHKALRPL
jgi:hypothetical protein